MSEETEEEVEDEEEQNERSVKCLRAKWSRSMKLTGAKREKREKESLNE